MKLPLYSIDSYFIFYSFIYITGDALVNVGRIAAATGAILLCENAFPRIDRGSGLPCLQV